MRPPMETTTNEGVREAVVDAAEVDEEDADHQKPIRRLSDHRPDVVHDRRPPLQDDEDEHQPVRVATTTVAAVEVCHFRHPASHR